MNKLKEHASHLQHLILNYEDIDINEYREEQKRLHELISNKDVEGLNNFHSNFYYLWFE